MKLPLQQFGVLLVVGLVEFILRLHAVAVHSIASGGESTRAVSAVVILAVSFGAWCRRRGLDVSEMRVHGDPLPDLRDAMLIVELVVLLAGGGEAGAGLLPQAVARA